MSIDQQNQQAIFADLFDKLPDEKFAKPQLGIEAQPSINLTKTMEQSLNEPLYYPALKDSVFAGDNVAIVLQSDLPHASDVLTALLEQLSAVDVAVADIVVVISPRMADQFGIKPSQYELEEDTKIAGKRPPIIPVEFGFTTINFQVHDAENQAGLSFLIGNEEAEPLHVNRLLVDADVILPVGSPNPGDTNQQFDCVYPDFASLDIKDRFAKNKGSFISRWQEIELVNNTLGSFFSIQVVVGPGDSIRQIFSGARKDAVDAARETTNKLWSFTHKKTADVIVATIESTSYEQTWDDFAAALVSASRMANTDGPIIVWSDINLPPDRNIRKALMSQFEDNISKKLTKTLQHVAAIVNEQPVFLRSHLTRNQVEELGLGFLESAEEVGRIAEPHATGLLIRDAHKCQIQSS